jgi:hypothetical protein
MLVNNFSISFIVTNNLYVLDFELFLSIPWMLEGKKKTDYSVDKDNFIKLRLNL